MKTISSLKIADIKSHQEKITAVILQAAHVPGTLEDLNLSTAAAAVSEADAKADVSLADRSRTFFLMAVYRDALHASQSGRQSLLIGLNGQARAMFDLAVASKFSNTST